MWLRNQPNPPAWGRDDSAESQGSDTVLLRRSWRLSKSRLRFPYRGLGTWQGQATKRPLVAKRYQMNVTDQPAIPGREIPLQIFFTARRLGPVLRRAPKTSLCRIQRS